MNAEHTLEWWREQERRDEERTTRALAELSRLTGSSIYWYRGVSEPKVSTK